MRTRLRMRLRRRNPVSNFLPTLVNTLLALSWLTPPSVEAAPNYEDYLKPSLFLEEFNAAYDSQNFERADFLILRFPDTSLFYTDPPDQLNIPEEKSSYIGKILKERRFLKNDEKLRMMLQGRWAHKSGDLIIEYRPNGAGSLEYDGETYPLIWRIRNSILLTTIEGETTAERIMSISSKRYTYIDRRNDGLVFLYRRALSTDELTESLSAAE